MKNFFKNIIETLNPTSSKNINRNIQRLKKLALEEGCYTSELEQIEIDIDGTSDENLKLKLKIKFKNKLNSIVNSAIIKNQYDRAW
ncbi:hypothetical protein SAMN05421866_3478 [Chryseobacterium oranimense]|uniref:Uncharacterized protein n=1 Tax=Chryseobacterium oranimense TaxID=421058 RepID=A0A1M5V0P0_9FLAO|nr:hypothetical protein [Chryseobacterium oranimense]SHH68658.1 hypothetical protein SAMN05421866_3478 [Chryseobacterium oranimense]